LSELEQQIKELIGAGEVRISEHGYDELADDGLNSRELVSGANGAELLEEYADYPKGPCVLFLQKDHAGNPVHAVWGIPKGHNNPVVLVTAYRPDPDRWDSAYRKRV